MKHLIHLSLLFYFAAHGSILLCAARSGRPQDPNQPQVVYVPVATYVDQNQPTEDEQADRVLLNNSIQIVGNFANILLDPNNKPQVAHNLSNVVGAIAGIAQAVIRMPMTRGKRQKCFKLLTEYIERLQQLGKQMQTQ